MRQLLNTYKAYSLGAVIVWAAILLAVTAYRTVPRRATSKPRPSAFNHGRECEIALPVPTAHDNVRARESQPGTAQEDHDKRTTTMRPNTHRGRPDDRP